MLNLYQELYTSKNIQNEKIESYLSQINEIPKLDNDNTQLLELYVLEAVNNIKRKSPLG